MKRLTVHPIFADVRVSGRGREAPLGVGPMVAREM